MREIIATIKLAPGQVGYYDEYSKIHLTIAHPETAIYSGTNCAQIRRSIKAGRIILTSGTLGAEVAPVRIIKTPTGVKIVSNKDAEHAPIVANVTPVAEETVDLTKEIKEAASEPEVAEVIEDKTESAESEVTEEAEATEETVEEVEKKNTTKKRGRRKKAEKAE